MPNKSLAYELIYEQCLYISTGEIVVQMEQVSRSRGDTFLSTSNSN